MHIYTHLVIAKELQPHLLPQDQADYYLGSIIPDVRYLSGARRQQTHLNAAQLLAYKQRFPHLESFLLGYLVHCETDLLDLSRSLFQSTPVRVLGTLRQLQLAGLLIESHFLEHTRIHPPLASGSNEMLAALGIDPAHVIRFAEGVRRFLSAPSIAAELEALQTARIVTKPPARIYTNLVSAFEHSRMLRKLIFSAVPVEQVAEKLPSILLASPAIKNFAE
jgi:hypothetical protein